MFDFWGKFSRRGGRFFGGGVFRGPTSGRVKRGFTLIELLVVIAIMVIILAVSIPGLKAITKGNDTVQATNMLSSLIANARSIAISQGRIAGVALYEENGGSGGQTTMRQTAAYYVIEDRAATVASRTGTLYLQPLDNSTIQQLPTGAKVAVIDTTNGAGGGMVNTGGNANYVPARLILFDESGQLLVRSNILLAASVDPTIQTILTSWAADWHWSTLVNNTVNNSSPALVVYSADEFNSAGLVTAAAGRAESVAAATCKSVGHQRLYGDGDPMKMGRVSSFGFRVSSGAGAVRKLET